MNQQRRLAISLLLLRLSVFLVMLMWTVDKFVRPDHAAGVFSTFYGITGLDAQVAYVLGALELVVLLAFVAGIARRWSYGLVLVLHAVSTLATWRQYLDPFEGTNLLFFAAWPRRHPLSAALLRPKRGLDYRSSPCAGYSCRHRAAGTA